ncbi:MAG: hypothetical protein EXS36_14060, partial [Pedosphaera sp.]|nr:hypothetical protein [Pedosphaera sp.]
MFLAPNMCVPIELKPTDTSIVIPGNTLRPGRRYRGRLSYSNGDYLTSSLPGYVLGGSVNTDTEFPINDPEARDAGTSDGSPPTMGLSSDRTQVLVTATLGQTFSLYGSTDLVTWSKLSTGIGAGTTAIPFLVPSPRTRLSSFIDPRAEGVWRRSSRGGVLDRPGPRVSTYGNSSYYVWSSGWSS